ncbi:MAG: hypothetical protein IJR86_02595 [Bacteroidaceae bacterium]|nr:hypothetical protein [Bacteroidaceae bacterium]
MATELAIIRKENIEVIVSSAPAAYNENTVSHDRCIDAGKALLARMQQGMTDELDQEAATFIEKARKTVRKMNDKRAPLTKLFDEIRTTFTGMENDIDASKNGSIPYMIQQERNRFAAKKREEELARQREEMRKQQIKQAGIKYRSDCDDDYRRQLRGQLDFYICGLRNLFADVTLDNYSQRLSDIDNFDINFPENFLQTLRSAAPLPPTGMFPSEELQQVRTASLNAIMRTFRDEFKSELSKEKMHIQMLMPSKKMELERAAKASAEEAERIRQQMKEREEAEAKRMELERQQREQQQRMESDMKAKQEAMGDLFDQASVSAPTYQPKTSVKKKLVPLNAEAFPEIFTLWWTKEGCSLSVDELAKMFKKQITFCEKCANKDGEFIQSEHIYYEDEVKAK